MAEVGTSTRPLRVAIIGSGPSGFYAADPLLKSETSCIVDMYDRLPTPYGLVRGGVAPDHPKIRSVTKVYEKIAANEAFTFFGNVQIGKDLTVEELREHYDAIIFACGAETDRRMHIPGEDLLGSHTATSFVGWYNGHPDYRDLEFDLSSETAFVIGVGNVAMDVARILAKTVDELKATDIASHALEVLAESKVKNIYIVGRRGPAQAKFTPPELKEMGELADCDPVVLPEELVLNAASEEEQSEPSVKRNMELLREFAERTPAPEKGRRMHLRFLLSPTEIVGAEQVEAIRLEKNRLSGEAFRQWAEPAGEYEEIPCGLVFRSIGYRGVPIPGVPFDDRAGKFPNDGGRITEDGIVVPGLYAVGWIKRGPSGVIGTNKPDSLETARILLEDVPQLEGCVHPESGRILAILQERGVRVVSFGDWKKLDAVEIARGVAAGKPRERLTRIDEMLGFLE
jgi:ferredoxin--NADP+ reductase